MTKDIDFYFDFISPYTYIGHKRIEQQGSELNFIYKPIFLGGLHKSWNITPQAFIEPKKQFMIMDCEMVSKKLNIDFKFNSKFPLGTVKLMLSGPSSPGTQYVPSSSFLFLALVIGGIIFAPVGLEVVINRIMQNSPEMYQAKIETDYSSEE